MRGDLIGIVSRWRDLTEVRPDNSQPFKPSNNLKGLQACYSPDFRHWCSRRKCRINTVNIQGEIGLGIPDDLMDLFDNGLSAIVIDFVREHDANADVFSVIQIAGIEERFV